MMKQKLELTWSGKASRSRLEPRILLAIPSKSYYAVQRVTENYLDSVSDYSVCFRGQ